MAIPGTKYAQRFAVTLMPGDGIGRELCNAVKIIFKAANVTIDWEEINIGTPFKGVTAGLPLAIESLKRTKIGLKGKLPTMFRIYKSVFRDILYSNFWKSF